MIEGEKSAGVVGKLGWNEAVSGQVTQSNQRGAGSSPSEKKTVAAAVAAIEDSVASDSIQGWTAE